tara:strand:+ start:1112 stop:1444 length:333 start_codon:yes stop_codon:yes gene_type:complete
MYNKTIEEVVQEYGGVDIITFMFYAEPGHKDLIILKAGIQDIYSGPFFINIKEIDEEHATAYNVQRGWKLTFMFAEDIKELEMSKWISMGLAQLRVKFDLIEVREIVGNV